ncbi:RrF2 family transcriptional regulator [Vulgatibacter sp.]|uniref:RrF2 family transcriptional regulator n=1 Tax=Vulgatibacter sp. TaxID=1971226 RepID=UPI003566BA1B
MLFNQTAEYALRAMAHLALLPEGTSVRARDLSAATGIPPDYVSKVLRRMVREGLLLSQKGHGGGFRLARPPAAIRFADVLAALDEGLDPERCAFGWGACGGHAPCPLHNAFSKLKAAVNTWASETTLADVGDGTVQLPQVSAAG